MSKTKVIDLNSEISVMQERLILSNIRSQYIVNMICSFQDMNSLYLGLELMKGGDLRFHLINNYRLFTERQIKFLLANLIKGLEYIHSQNIVHRDLKPENILFDIKGYAYITDFNISCKIKDINKFNIINGTPAYMAPETINHSVQDFCIDFYSLGIICYECAMGKRPYEGSDFNHIKKILKEEDFSIQKNENISDLLRDLINRLLIKNPCDRIGYLSGANEIKEHLFFNNLNWDYLDRRKYVSPLIEVLNYSRSKMAFADELFDPDFCNKNEEEIDDNTRSRYLQIMNHQYYANYFEHYTYLSKEAINEIIRKDDENMMAAPPKKSLSYCKSTDNIKLPRLRTGNHNYSNNEYSSNVKPKNNYSLRDFYEYKLNKYKKLLKSSNNIDMEEPIHNFPNHNNNYYPPPPNRNELNGNDVYNQVCNGLQRKLYMDIFGDMGLNKYMPHKNMGLGMPNQYQINNYYPPSFMGMPNPYYFMMNPFPMKNDGFFLPNIYDKHNHKHKHKHRHKLKSNYSKSSYISSKYKSSRKSDGSETTKTRKKKKNSTDEDKSSEEDTKKSKKKKKKSKKSENEDEESEDNEDEEKEDSEDEDKEDNEEKEDDEDDEGEEKEDNEEEDEEEDSKKKKKGSDDEDEDEN